MSVGAQLTVTDMRRAARHPVDHKVIGEHRRLGDVHLHIINISAHGFMAEGVSEMERGERVSIRLPEIGRIEAHLIWATDERAGFQFAVSGHGTARLCTHRDHLHSKQALHRDEVAQILPSFLPQPRGVQ